jgi:hypothetical protein
MKIYISYLPAEDRLLFSTGHPISWLITRSLLIKLVNAMIDKLQKVELPDVGFSLGGRDIGQEHALSLEFDRPTTTQKKPDTQVKSRMLEEVTLTVDSVSANLVLRCKGFETNLTLTRKESHLVLEMLVNKARAVNWLSEVMWPNWLGSTQNNE